MLKLLIIAGLAVGTVFTLTCYNGSKMLAMQSVGETTEECPDSSYCYNMSTTAYVMLNMVKAGCSRWRCMLAKDTCIFTTFQMVPVSLCCCSYDRCNVGGNPVYSDNPKQIQGSGSNWGNNGNSGNSGNSNNGPSGGSWGNGNNNGGQNNNGWGNNNDWSSNYNYGGQNSAKEEKMIKQDAKDSSSSKKKWTDKQLEEMWKKSIDDKGDEIQLEDDFKKVDKNYKTQSIPQEAPRTLSARKEVEHMPLGAKNSGGGAKPTTSSAAPKSGGSKEINL
ncbi:CRE-PQN-24 protein [Caenorhabditis remanei]|uniref:CRE-PQN-24 protein n=1 Tax=Caenorhabditis remanei TaxID=31234 RepID=E3LXI0_CAERE|nr:CRE-PQN-24 protein [Caenorhabditis remanei]